MADMHCGKNNTEVNGKMNPKQVGPNSWTIEIRENGKVKELLLDFPVGSLDQAGEEFDWVANDD